MARLAKEVFATPKPKSYRRPNLPEQALKRFSQPFWRSKTFCGRTTGGSGLGLAITKRCIEACNGTVTAQNRRGDGLLVTIELPANS